MTGNFLLEVEDLSKSFYNNKVLDDINFAMNYGEILGIVGENGAGKSTLIKLLSGVHKPDTGIIKMDGVVVNIRDVNIAENLGISVVFQELSVFLNLNVAENIFAARQPYNRIGFVNWKTLNEKTIELLEKFDIDVKYDRYLRELDFADRQIIEILKALSVNPKLFILDEPTSALAENDVDRLFKLIFDLKKNNFSIIYISHYLEEVLSVSDRIMVLRDGKNVGIFKRSEIDKETLVKHIIGKEIKDYFGKIKKEEIEVKKEKKKNLELMNLTKHGHYSDISFDLYEGEILGIAELTGGIKDKIFKTIFGAIVSDSGKIILDGKEVRIRNTKEAIKKGINYITQDRKKDGLFLSLDVMSNIVSSILTRISRNSFLIKSQILITTKKFVEMLRIRLFNYQQKVMYLSGGNQQKVLVSKCLSSNPSVLIANDPTRGIDIGAKSDIHSLLRELASKGVSIILTSSDYDEIINMCDRIIVFSKGIITRIFKKEEYDLKEILISMNE